MNSLDLIKSLIKRLKKFSWLIILIGLSAGAFFYYMAKQSIVYYTAKATVFPLNSSAESAVGGSIGSILGISDAPRSFSSEASINIIELATSKRIRDSVSNARVRAMENKCVGELLVDEINANTGFMKNESINKPKDPFALMNLGSSILRSAFASKITKNGILELSCTNSNPDLAREICYIYIDKISSFYIDLKKRKAQNDYDFAVQKADSLRSVLNILDKRAVQLDESSFFTNEELQRFSIPKVNLSLEKQTVQSQYYYAVSNREGAAYRLQKATPIIESLDRPEPPYEVTAKSPKTYAIIGFALGAIIGLVLVSWAVIRRFIGAELNKAIAKATKQKEELVLEPQTEPIK